VKKLDGFAAEPEEISSMASNTDIIWVNRAAKAILLIRILVGWVFLSEGIQKFLFPESLGVGRFVKIGIPLPQLMAPFVGVTEIICGALLLVGLFTRLACVPLLIDICVALYSTKIVTFMKNGFWGTLHEARTDVSMLLGLIFLLIVGGGTLALDARSPEGLEPKSQRIDVVKGEISNWNRGMGFVAGFGESSSA